jgi:hypothetical protein
VKTPRIFRFFFTGTDSFNFWWIEPSRVWNWCLTRVIRN